MANDIKNWEPKYSVIRYYSLKKFNQYVARYIVRKNEALFINKNASLNPSNRSLTCDYRD